MTNKSTNKQHTIKYAYRSKINAYRPKKKKPLAAPKKVANEVSKEENTSKKTVAKAAGKKTVSKVKSKQVGKIIAAKKAAKKVTSKRGFFTNRFAKLINQNESRLDSRMLSSRFVESQTMWHFGDGQLSGSLHTRSHFGGWQRVVQSALGVQHSTLH